jgi:hypothetical protein
MNNDKETQFIVFPYFLSKKPGKYFYKTRVKKAFCLLRFYVNYFIM